MKKLAVLPIFLLTTSLMGCGKAPTGNASHNPFTGKTLLSKEAALTKLNDLMVNLDKTATYTATYHYNNESHTPSEDSQNYYVAQYSGVYEEGTYADTGYYAKYNFTYIENSLDPAQSNIAVGDRYFHNDPDIGDGLHQCISNLNESMMVYSVYEDDSGFYLYGEFNENGYLGYVIKEMDKNGLITYLESYESEGSYYYKMTFECSFTSGTL